MITAPANAEPWAHEFARTIDDALNNALMAIPRAPIVDLADLVGGQLAPSKFFSSKAGMRMTGMLGVVASGGLTICFSDGTDWIDLQTGSPVA